MDFITIDFETANSSRNSACEIGLTIVQNDKIIDTLSWLIKPEPYYFDSFNTMIHGISKEHVADAGRLDEIWHEILPIIQNKFLIAHNASFDISVLRNSLDVFEIPYPDFEYGCSYIFSKHVWKGMSSFGLKDLCQKLGIDLVHHRAAADSRATAELCLRAFELQEVTSINDFPTKLNTHVGRLFQGGYNASHKHEKYRYENKLRELTSNTDKNNQESIFFEKIVVFTGTMSSMTRLQAAQIIIDIGGYCKENLTANADYMVVGYQDYKRVGEDGMSTKQEKAMKLIEQGSKLEVISEQEFLKHI